jgi:hypothetical protein
VHGDLEHAARQLLCSIQSDGHLLARELTRGIAGHAPERDTPVSKVTQPGPSIGSTHEPYSPGNMAISPRLEEEDDDLDDDLDLPAYRRAPF